MTESKSYAWRKIIPQVFNWAALLFSGPFLFLIIVYTVFYNIINAVGFANIVTDWQRWEDAIRNILPYLRITLPLIFGAGLLSTFLGWGLGIANADKPYGWIYTSKRRHLFIKNNAENRLSSRSALYKFRDKLIRILTVFFKGFSFIPSFALCLAFIILSPLSWSINAEFNLLRFFIALLALALGDILFLEIYQTVKEETQYTLTQLAIKGAVARNQSIHRLVKKEVRQMVIIPIWHRIVQLFGLAIITEIILELPGLGYRTAQLVKQVKFSSEIIIVFYEFCVIIFIFSLLSFIMLHFLNLAFIRGGRESI